MNMKYDTLLMDADGTLLDFDRSEAESLLFTLRQNGLPDDDVWVKTYHEINDSLWKELELRKITKSTLRTERFARLLAVFGAQGDVLRIADCYTDRLADSSYLLPGAYEVCQALHASCRLYLITNGIQSVQQKRFAGTPLMPLFEKCYISDSVGYEKPDRRFFDFVARDIPDFDSRRTLVVGDSLTSDMRGAVGAGLDCCWLNPQGKALPPELRVTFEIRRLEELLTILSGEDA